MAARLRRLKQSGYIASDSILPGTDYRSMIDDALRGATAVIVVLTNHADKSMWVTYEWAFALGAKIAVIPVIMSKMNLAKLHPRLEALNHLDLTGKNEKNWRRLVAALIVASRSSGSSVPLSFHQEALNLNVSDADRKTLISRFPKSEWQKFQTAPDYRTILFEEVTPAAEQAEPQMYAKFELTKDKPLKIQGCYSISIAIRNIPSSTRRVFYKILDDTFSDAEFSVDARSANFEETITSYGDVPITASDKRKGGTWRIRTTLMEALRRQYGWKPRPSIQKALSDIAAN
jgi:hypothetical protein